MTLRLANVEVPVRDQSPEKHLGEAISDLLGVPASYIKFLQIRKKSLDARRKARIMYHYQVDVDLEDEAAVLAKNAAVATAIEQVTAHDPLEGLPISGKYTGTPPVIIGSGPAGIFAALTLSRAGIPSIIVERGDPVEKRLRKVGALRRRGELSEESNYCFGEGGAGTFSDGKLTCGKNHPLIRHVFDEFVRFGSPPSILYEAKPHIGTDNLVMIAKKMRDHLIAQGCTFLFGKRFLSFDKHEGAAHRYTVALHDGTRLETDHLILAVGHSARDTYEMLLAKGVAIVPKPFAIGARFEHPQEAINKIQFGSCDLLPAAEYKLATQAGNRGIWTFCMCPGGHLLPTSAQEGHLAINGMSYHGRKSGFANAAVVVNVLREDFYRGHPLDGMRFQQQLEQKAFAAGGGGYTAPAQRLTDFLKGRTSQGTLNSTYKPGVVSARLDQVLPEFVVDALRVGVVEYNKKMRGFIKEDALVVGLESKTSSPISMVRDKNLQSVSHAGLFPTGEGAGFAGGIVSAALDGVRVGRAVVEDILQSGADGKI